MRVLAALSIVGLLATSCGDDGDASKPTQDGSTTTIPAPIDAAPTTAATVPADTVTVALCEDVERAIPTVIGTLPGGTNLPWELTGVLRTYAAEHPETFAELWIDRDYGGTAVLAFTDDPGPHLEEILQRRPQDSDIATIEPRPPLTVDWTVAESGYAVDVVQVDYSEADLAAVRESVRPLYDRDDLPIVGSGGGGIINRISIDLIRPTAEHIALIGEALGPGIVDAVCVNGPLWDDSIRLPTVDDPFSPMADAGVDPAVTCGGWGPTRLSILDDPPDIAADSDDPLHVALRVGGVGGGPVPAEGWRTLLRSDEAATLYWTDGSSFLIHTFENGPAGWSLRGSSAGSGECPLRLALADGLGIMEIRLDPDNPPEPTSTTLHLLVNQRSCSGGASGVENMLTPEVIESDGEILLAIGVIPPEGPQTCPGNEAAPITIELAAPIGDRAILDGLAVPPEPLESGPDF
ncbi:MAG: hypothetical protein AAF548_17185 [Actinomycetota bacterium]